MSEMHIHVGKFTLRRTDRHTDALGDNHGPWWLENEEGEGMELSDENLEAMLAEYFEQNF